MAVLQRRLCGGSADSAGPPLFPLHEVHHDVLTECHRAREVSLATCDLRNFLNELHEVGVLREHERVDRYTPLTACGYLVEGSF